MVATNLSAPAGASLGALADPAHLQGPIEVRREDAAWLTRALRDMVLIRRIEEVIGDLVSDATAKCPCHLAIGQEAVAVGVARYLRPTDKVFGAHRSHAHFLALGGSPFELLAEVLGRAPGCSRGMGGSMHLIKQEIGFYGSVPIVGATVPIATGAGLAAKMDGAGGLAVSFFGDGATEEGVVHESLNLAASMKLPVVFVCENNLFSSHLHISLRQPGDRVARYAEAHCMPAYTIDGNDVVAVADVCREAFDRARAGGGPSFVEAVTYRWRGHVGHREDIDVGVKRGEELTHWKQRDPLRRLAESLVAAGVVAAGDFEWTTRAVADEVAAALEAARAAPYPATDALLDLVYSEGRS